jgi:maltooligosyltrehalose trehalohydrolase
MSETPLTADEPSPETATATRIECRGSTTAPPEPGLHGRTPANIGVVRRRLPVGAECSPDGGVRFRVWAPRRKQVTVVLEDEPDRRAVPLAAEGNGYFSGLSFDAGVGTLYRFRLDDDDALYPDPASRFQPLGPFGPSRVVDPTAFAWTDAGWAGASLRGQVIYEMHIGTFTGERTWAAAARELAELAELGVTCVEMMPIAEFAGRFGWGYDGVDLFAPTHLYGEPDDLCRFVDQAHRHGLAVILDVVYNHLGPDGNYLMHFSPDYFTDRHETDWGAAINFDGLESVPVREFFLANARAWIEEFHFDGLRLDATQSIFDESPEHIVTALAREVRAAARGRATLIVVENEPQHSHLVRSIDRGGFGLDALWNDDLHHSAMVALTGKKEAYYTDYNGSPQEFVSAAKWGFLYQGQRYKWQRRRRGRPALDLPPASFVGFIENHDQVANAAHGWRLHRLTSPGRYRAMTAYLLLAPSTPMLFQGQEFASSAPFLYFADHRGELGAKVREGRAAFLAQFASIATPEVMATLPDPTALDTFERCTLDFEERRSHESMYRMHRDLLRLRRRDPVLSAQRPRGVDGAVLGPEAFVLRFFGEAGADRLLVVNLGTDLTLNPAPEPLLAPPADALWRILWSSDDVRYGGAGVAPIETRQNWRVPGHAAVLLEPQPAAGADDPAGGEEEETEEAESRRDALRRLGAV